MIEAMMFYALGVLSAGIFALLVVPPLWRRAVRLTQRSIELTLPMTRAEIQAEKDQIRAAFAVSTRRLDATIEKLEGQVADQVIEINRRREIISHLTAEGSLSAEDMIALEKQRDELLLKVAAQNGEIAEAARLRATFDDKIAALEKSLEESRGKLETMIAERETQRLEIVARDTELDNLRDSVAAVKTSSTVDEVARAGLETGMSELRANLAMERRKRDEADALVADIDAKRVAGLAELAARDAEITLMREEAQLARSKIEELSMRLVEAEAAGMSALAIEESKAELEARLAHLETTNGRLIDELAALRAEKAKSGEAEMAVLRGKLIDIGTAVARLSTRPEGPSLVPAIAGETEKAKPQEDERQEPAPAAISLAERIRALQHAGGSF